MCDFVEAIASMSTNLFGPRASRLAGTAGIAALLLVASAARADVTVGVSAGTQSDKAGATGKLHLVLAIGETAAAKPPRLAGLVLQLPRGASVDSGAADFFSARKLRAGQSCPDKARVGSGSATLDVREGGNEQVTGPVVACNAKALDGSDESRIILVITQTQIGARAVVEGRVVRNGESPFGYTMRFDSVPAIQTSSGTSASLVKLDIDVRARRTKRSRGRKQTFNYYTNPATCSGQRLWFFGAEVTLEGGQPLSVSRPLACTTG